jgi:acyl-coenzyme A synthetase/AMP-(fatty) acid ligase
VDSAILAHPGVAEAVCFAAPDEKYGEVVAAAVVLNKQGKGMNNIGGWCSSSPWLLAAAAAAAAAVFTLLACSH